MTNFLINKGLILISHSKGSSVISVFKCKATKVNLYPTKSLTTASDCIARLKKYELRFLHSTESFDLALFTRRRVRVIESGFDINRDRSPGNIFHVYFLLLVA